jgi:hypothetical protein
MRIGASAPLPPAPVVVLPPAVAAPLPAGSAADRAALMQVAALVAATPWLAAENAAGERPATGVLPNLQAAALAAVPAGASPAAGQMAALTPSLGAALAAPLSAGIVPMLAGQPASASQAAVATAGATMLGAALGGDRLSLSPATAALRTDAAGLRGQPTAEFTLDLLGALTGEPKSRLQLLAFGAQTPAAAAGFAARGPQELLQLLVRATIHGADAQQLDLTLGMSLQRQTGAPALDRAVLDSLRATLEQLAQTTVDLDYPGSAAALAGQSARFQAVLDPLGLWPMQSFLLSGLLIFSRARIDEVEVDDVEDPDAEAALDEQRESGREREDQKPPEPQALAVEEQAPLPDDGGPPIISASQWLELELRHWRLQIRQWMALPAV